MTATTTAILATPAYAVAPTVASLAPTNGPIAGGTTVTITGTNLTGATGVTFDGVAATGVAVVDGTHVTAVSPTHAAGTAAVEVTVPGGGGGTSANGINFTYLAVPTTSAASPTGGKLAGGDTVTITGTGFVSGMTATFGGVAGTSPTYVSPTSMTVVTPANSTPGAVPVVVTTPGGSSSVGATFMYTAVPTATAVNASSGPAAGGTSVTITGTNLTGATGITFGGVAGTGLSVTNATTAVVTTPAHAAGSTTVVVTTLGGPSVTTLNYTFVDAPTVSAAVPATGDALGGNTVTLTGTNLTGATGVTFGGVAGTSLSVTNATTATVKAPAHPAGAATVPIVVTTVGGPSTGFNYDYTVPANTAPSVTQQPLAQSVQNTASATFTAMGSGWPWPTVQWQVKAAGGSSWSDVSGATTTTLTFTAASADNGKQYRAVFHNTSGVDAMTGPATLTVVPDPPDAVAAPTLTAGVSSIIATWVAPEDNGAPVTGYIVNATPGPATCTTTGLTCVLGASAGTAYTVRVVAKSDAGYSALSSASNSVTPTAPTIPTEVPTTSDQLVTDQGPINAAEPGQSLTLTGSGYAPYATVVITIYSAPQQLGSVTADGSGNFTTTVTLPSDLAATTHSLVASGIDTMGAAKVSRMDVYVSVGATVKMRGPIVRNGSGLAQMFARGADDYLYTSVQAMNGTWGTWTNLSGLIYSEPTAALNNNGRITVYAIGGDHSVWYRLQNGDGTFAWWTRLGAPKWASDFKLGQNQDGTTAVFVKGSDDNLYSQVQTDAADPTQWSGWTNLGGLIYSQPTVFTRDDGIMEVFAVGGDGKVWHRVQAAPNSGTWSWWSHV